MSEKSGISFNKHVMIENLSINKVKNITKYYTVVDKIGSKMKKNYFVLTGKIYIYK